MSPSQTVAPSYVLAVFNHRQRAENAVREIQRQCMGPEDRCVLATQADSESLKAILGALAKRGASNAEVQAYIDLVKRGEILVAVRTSSIEAANLALDILERHNAADVQPGANPGAEPLSADEVRRERQYYGPSGLAGVEALDSDPASHGKTHWPHRKAYDQGASLQASRLAHVYFGSSSSHGASSDR